MILSNDSTDARSLGRRKVKQRRADWALFVDFDGTLVDIAPSPSEIQVPGDLSTLLARLALAVDGAFAIVTGRSVADIEQYIAPAHPVVAGAHGAEIRAHLNQLVLAAPPLPARVCRAVEELSDAAGGTIEMKRASIAVHFRSNPSAGCKIEAGLRKILERESSDLIMRAGRKVYEVMPRRVSKGAAIEALLQFPQFQGRRPLFIGDDPSDESALEFVERMGGVGLRVAGEHFPKNGSDFDDPAEVRDWLATFAKSYGL